MASKTATKFYLSTRYITAETALEAVAALARVGVEIVANVENVDEYGWRSIYVRTARDAERANLFLAGFEAGKAAA